MNRVAAGIKRHTGLIKYTILNYADKALAFAVPLAVLYLFDDRATYNEIEYIFSLGAVLAVVIELGVRNYSLYAYRNAADRDDLVNLVKGAFLVQFAAYTVIAGLFLGLLWLYDGVFGAVYAFIAVRALFMYFVSFFTIYYRLVDRPSTVFAFSVAVNAVTVAVLLICYTSLDSLPLGYFFAAQGVLALAVLVYFASSFKMIDFTRVWRYARQALVFAWPIILNVFLFMFICNYGRVYARNFLPESDMFHISFVQRVALIIQLAHASGVGYLSKKIFIETKSGINRRVLALYSGMLGVAVIGVLGVLLGAGIADPSRAVPLDTVTYLLIAYTLLWCFVAFFELYMNRMNKNKFVLAFSIAAAAVFLGVLHFFGGDSLLIIATAMVAGMSVNLGLLLTFLIRKERRDNVPQTTVDDYQCTPA